MNTIPTPQGTEETKPTEAPAVTSIPVQAPAVVSSPTLPVVSAKPPTTAINTNKIKALEHLETLKTHALTFAGKEGMNPFMYINVVIRPNLALLNETTCPESAIKSILSLTKEDPTIAKFHTPMVFK